MRTLRAHLAAPLLAVAAVAVFAVWVDLSVGGATATRTFDDLATVVASALATLTCYLAARNNAGRTRVFWLLLAGACAAWTFGEGAWAVYDAVGGDVPVPSYADIGYLAAIPLALAALTVQSSQGRDGRQQLRAGLDMFILATALLFLSSTLILHAVGAQNDLTSAAGVITIAYPVGDVLMIFLLLRAVRWLDGPDRIAMACILVGLLAMTLSDSGYTYLTSVHDYATGSSIDTGWIVAYLGIALGGWYGRQTVKVVERTPAPATTTLSLVLPYLLPLMSLGVLTVRAEMGQHVDRVSLGLAFVLTGSVLIRQVHMAFAGEAA